MGKYYQFLLFIFNIFLIISDFVKCYYEHNCERLFKLPEDYPSTSRARCDKCGDSPLENQKDPYWHCKICEYDEC